MRDLRAAIEALANDWEANFAINQVHLTCIEQLRAILAECEEPLPTIHDLRGIVPYARLREALSRLVDVAEVYSADQAGATHPLCGLVQPISVVEGRELNDALAQANAALSVSGPEEPDLADETLPLMPTSKRTVTLYREPQDAPIVREFLWLNHGCPISHLYGDDGEMQCSNGPHRPLDFKRQELPVLVRAILAARIEATKSAALPAPKRYRCRACEQEFDSKVGMHREHITDIDGSWCSGIVEEMP